MKKIAQKEIIDLQLKNRPIKCWDYNDRPPNALCFPFHWHERLEILVMTLGNLKVDTGKQSFEAKPGDVVIFNPNEVHEGLSNNLGAGYYVLSINLELVALKNDVLGSLINSLINGDIVFQNLTSDPIAYNCCFKAAKYLTETKNENSFIDIGFIYNILGNFYNLNLVATNPNKSSAFSAVTEFIDQHYTEKISTKTISKKFGYTESYFCRFFKTYVGISPMKYITSLRLQHAENLLKNSNLNITEIAMQSGFSDMFYFSSTFKKSYGISPSEFRETNIIPSYSVK